MNGPFVRYDPNRGLCAYLDGELVYCESRPQEIQRVFFLIGLGDVTLGTARFTGERLKYVALEAAQAWQD